MCSTSLTQPVLYVISVVSIWIEYKSYFSWHLFPTVFCEECSETLEPCSKLQRWCCSDLMMTIDIIVLKLCAITVPIGLIAVKITANSTQIPAVQQLQMCALKNKDSHCLHWMTANFNYFNTLFFFHVFFVGYPKQEKLATKI